MGEVKRYVPAGGGVNAGDNMIHIGDSWIPSVRSSKSLALYVAEDDYETLRSDYVRLERERDQAMAAHADMVREVEASQAEMARLRAVGFAAHAVIESSVSGRTAAGRRYYMTCPEQMRDLAEACGRKW